MNIGVFSISEKYKGFHRFPILNALSSELNKDGGRLFYFKIPKWFLSADRPYRKIDHVDNTTSLPLYTLLPSSKLIGLPWLYYLFVSLPIKYQFNRYQKKFKKNISVVWFYKPDQYFFMKHLKQITCYTHYDNYDDDIHYTFSKHLSYPKTLQSMISSCDFVFSTSHKLVDKLDAILNQKKTIYMPNAVSDMWLGHPISNEKNNSIGFVGSIDDSIDANIIKSLCCDFPNYKIIMAGRVTSTIIQALSQQYDNLILLGVQPYEALPSIVASFDVGICPYKLSSFNQYRNPLKLYEYSAMGIPSVSTACDFDREGKNLVTIVNSTSDFSAAVRLALASDNKENKVKRRSFIQKHTWTVRAIKMLDHIRGLKDGERI